MKYGKLIAVGVSAFGLGGLFSWAITADYYDAKLKSNSAILTSMLQKQNDELGQLYFERHRYLTQDEMDALPFEEGGPLIPSEDDPVVQEPIQTPDVPEGVEGLSGSAKLIKEMQLHSLSLDYEPGPGGGEIISVKHSEEPVDGLLVTSPMTEVDGEETGVETEEVAVPAGETVDETRAGLASLIAKYTADPVDREIFNARAQAAVDPRNLPPRVISQAEYAWGEDGAHYAKITVMYFERHRVLLDDDQDPIEDIESFVGWRSLSQFGFESNDPDVVFVRNDRLETDFEIVRDQEGELPIHVRYGMNQARFKAEQKAGNIPFRDDD